MPELPENCAEYATHPLRLHGALDWETCGTGCEQLVAHESLDVFVTDGWSKDGNRYLNAIAHERSLPERLRRRMVILLGADGAVLARRDSETCLNGSVTGHEYVGYRVIVGAADDVVGHGLYADPLAGLASPPVPRLLHWPNTTIPNGNSIRVSGVSSALFAGNVQPIGYVYKVQGGEMEFLAGPSHPVANRNPQEVQVVGDHVLWWEGRSLTGDIWRLMHWTEEAGTEVLLERADASSYYLRTDGVDLAWVQAYDFDGRGFTRWELWTAPHTRVQTELSPRRVREIFPYAPMTIGGGYVHQLSRDLRALQAIRLRDGALLEFPLEEGWNSVSRPIAPNEEGVLWSIQTSPGTVRLFRLTWDAYTEVE